MSMKDPIKIEVQMCVYLYVVYESVKGSGQPQVREMDEDSDFHVLIELSPACCHYRHLQVPSFIMLHCGTKDGKLRMMGYEAFMFTPNQLSYDLE